MLNHLMVDIETLGTRNDSCVLTVGWCLFGLDPEFQLSAPVEFGVNLTQQVKAGRWVDPETLKWWMSQSDGARERAFNPANVLSVEDTGARLRTVIGSHAVEHVWSHGPAFDMAILKDLLGGDFCSHRMLRDTRTMHFLAPGVTPPERSVAHSAADDAYTQAKWVQQMYHAIMGGFQP